VRVPAVGLLPRAVARVPRLPRVLVRHWRRRLLALALLAAVLSAAYFLWLRDSSFVRIERVQVQGIATAPDAGALRADLTEAAKRMTTLHLNPAVLQRVAMRNPVVHSIEVQPDFPHGLVIHVVENRPVALLESGDHTVPVAADGTLLEGVEMHGRLPTLGTPTLPDGKRLEPGGALDRVTVAGAAPQALLARVASITIQPGKGFVVQLENGPAIWLGSTARLKLKWMAAAAVLAQHSSQGASYVDVRIPERTVAGGLPITEVGQPDPSDAAPADPTGQMGATPPATPAPAAPTTTQPAAPAPTATQPAVPVTPAAPAPSTNTQP
jgi:cell division protein FtsQ